MALITNIGDVFQCRLLFQGVPPEVAMNVLHYKLESVSVPGGGLWAGAPSYDVCPALAQLLYQAFSIQWAPFADSQVRMIGCDAQNISPEPKSRMYTYDPEAKIAGLVIDDPLPLQDCVTVLKHGPGASRHDLGRVFVCGFPESAQSAGTITADVAGDMAGFVEELRLLQEVLVDGNTLLFRPIIYSVDPGPPVVTREIPILETKLSDRVMKTQRRRRPGKGS